ncbi:MAG: alpha/beta hydrolase fold domain-containing protein [Bacteroidota bacterium]
MLTIIKKFSFHFFCLLFAVHAHAQFCTNDNRFTEVEYFNANQIEVDTGVIYAMADGQNLAMDIFYPSSIADTMQSRPFIMLFHGGAFISGNRTQMIASCIELVKRGFVAATVSYRLSSVGDVPARYKAAQDGHAAMRYIVEHSSTYGIDANWLFVGGESAGAILGISLVYDDQQEWQNRAPFNDLIAGYGLLYSNGNSLTNTYDLQGIFNNWGSLYVIAYDANEATPTISFHGEMDNIVNINLNPTNFTGGANIIHNLLTQDHVCSDLNVDSLGGHGIYQGQLGRAFRVSKAACFFKNIFCNTCTSSSTFDSIPANCLMALPVELANFEGAPVGQFIDLKWKTLSEINHFGFDIQKSNDGTNWYTIDFIEGEGNPFESNEYSYLDSHPFFGTNYYRLKQMDLDGAYTYSKVISIEYDQSKKRIDIYPNPTSKQLIISGELHLHQIQILNASGQTYQSFHPTGNIQTINLSTLPSGLYFVKIQNLNTHLFEIQKIIKE